MSVNYNDYKAAVERLRKVATKESLLAVYGNCQNPYMEVRFDKATIYDAEHDQTPATVDWLRGLPSHLCYINISVRLDGIRIMISDNECGDIKLLNPTRGDVITALRLFGKREGA